MKICGADLNQIQSLQSSLAQPSPTAKWERLTFIVIKSWDFYSVSYVVVQKRVNIAGLNFCLKRFACKAGPWLPSGNLDLGTVATVDWWEWFIVPKLLVQIICFLLNACFLSGSLEFWQVPGRGCLHDQLPVRALGAERASLVGNISHVLSQPVTGVITCILCGSWKRTLGSLIWSPLDSTSSAFYLC